MGGVFTKSERAGRTGIGGANLVAWDVRAFELPVEGKVLKKTSPPWGHFSTDP